MRNLLLAIFILSLFNSCVTINQGMVGVKRVRGVIDPQVLYEGRVNINPFNTTVFRIPTQIVNVRVELPLPSKEGLTIQSEISIQYHVSAASAASLLKEVGLNYQGQLIMPVFRSTTSDVSARFFAKDMHSGQRANIESEIKNRMNSILEKYGIIIDNVLLKSIKLPAGLTRAIEEKLEAEQEAQRMQFVKQQQTADAERRIIEAKGEREVKILEAEAEKQTLTLRAEAHANATRLQAEAEAKANQLLGASLSEEVLRYRAIEAFTKLASSPNTKLMINPTGIPLWGLPQDFMNISQTTAKKNQ
ncbi:MAG: SPFH domain-containing protein [Bacteroidia bacterium]|nr:SPFH domain-containing protein [Bacteroidia bacterium]